MSIVARHPSIVKPTRPRPTPRPFGEGIAPAPVLANLQPRTEPTPTRAERLAQASEWLADRQREHEMEARVAGVGQVQLDRAWWAGFKLGVDGVEAVADRILTFVERTSFR